MLRCRQPPRTGNFASADSGVGRVGPQFDLRAVVDAAQGLAVNAGIEAGIAIGRDGVQFFAANRVAAGANIGDRELQVTIQVNGDGAGGDLFYRLGQCSAGGGEQGAHCGRSGQ